MEAAERTGQSSLLEVEDLKVEFLTRKGTVQAVRGVSFDVEQGETVGIVGESGSGKSVTGLAIMGLVQIPGRVVGGDIRWKGETVVAPNNTSKVKRLRGRHISMVFQDPMTSLNPLFPIGRQITEVLERHLGMKGAKARERAVEMLDLVGIASPRQRLKQYPHEFSGGMRQRAMIAIALACEPELLIADEPTTALDVTIQAQILDLLRNLQQELGLGIIFITHDLGVVSGLCDRVNVMYAGKLAESGSVRRVFAGPGHPYTGGLLRSTPTAGKGAGRLVSIDGAPPNSLSPPSGCPFHARCHLADSKCVDELPPVKQYDGGQSVACWHAFDDSIVSGVR